MFEAAGTLYAYFTYGMHTCLNVVCGGPGVAEGCLLRAGEVVDGVDLARDRRERRRRAGAKPLREAELARGPASLVRALGAELSDSGARVDASPYSLELPSAPLPEGAIARSLRVGVSGPGGLEPFDWRFYLAGDPTVSRYIASKR